MKYGGGHIKSYRRAVRLSRARDTKESQAGGTVEAQPPRSSPSASAGAPPPGGPTMFALTAPLRIRPADGPAVKNLIANKTTCCDRVAERGLGRCGEDQ